MIKRLVLGVLPLFLLAGCATNSSDSSRSGSGKYYQNDGPSVAHPDELTPPPTPQVEPFKKSTLRPYTVLGKTYTPLQGDLPFTEEGTASWYGRQFHGQKTATGEIYNMHGYSAAHPTMPLPSYARVTNLQNGKSVIVRVNDRGPFMHNRIIDLSYEAARALEYANRGTAHVRVERLTHADIKAMNIREEPIMSAKSKPLPPAPITVAKVTKPSPTVTRTQSVTASVAQTPPPMPTINDVEPFPTDPALITIVPAANEPIAQPVRISSPMTPAETPAHVVSEPMNKNLPYKLQFGFFGTSDAAKTYVAHLEAVSSSLEVPLKPRAEHVAKGYRVLSENTYTIEEARQHCQTLKESLQINCFPYAWKK